MFVVLHICAEAPKVGESLMQLIMRSSCYLTIIKYWIWGSIFNKNPAYIKRLRPATSGR